MEFFRKQEMFFSRIFLLGIYQVYAKPLISYRILVYGYASKTILNKILLMQKRILRTIFFRRKFDHITENFSAYKIDNVFELLLDTVFKEVIYQTLGKSPFKFLDFNQLNNCRQTRARSLRMLRSKSVRSTAYYNRLALKCSSYTTFFRLIIFFQRTWKTSQNHNWTHMYKTLNVILSQIILNSFTWYLTSDLIPAFSFSSTYSVKIYHMGRRSLQSLWVCYDCINVLTK